MAASLSPPAILWVGDWNEVVDEKDGPKIVPLQPTWQAFSVKAGVPNIQVDFTPDLLLPLPARLRKGGYQICPDARPAAKQQLE